MVRTADPHLKGIETRAIVAILLRRKNEPPSTASRALTRDIWGTELKLEIEVKMVQDVRGQVMAKYGGCSVCLMIGGREETEHESGQRCPTLQLDDSAEGWLEFKSTLRFPNGIMCFNCLLPTVRRFTAPI